MNSLYERRYDNFPGKLNKMLYPNPPKNSYHGAKIFEYMSQLQSVQSLYLDKTKDQAIDILVGEIRWTEEGDIGDIETPENAFHYCCRNHNFFEILSVMIEFG